MDICLYIIGKAILQKCSLLDVSICNKLRKCIELRNRYDIYQRLLNMPHLSYIININIL
jgi:hypothetical protein